MQSKISIFCEKIIEAGWLVAIVVVPLFFNIYSQRVFEPDKLSLLRSIALLMFTAWIIRFIDCHGCGYSLVVHREKPEGKIDRQHFWQHLFHTPFVVPVLLLAGVYLLSTLSSVVPRISLWGSYTRLQGIFTMLCYLVIFFAIMVMMRREEQMNRLWSALILTSIPISFYGLLQHFHLDPVAWPEEKALSVPARVVSSMGNPIFLGAYLIMVIPITLARIIEIFSLPLDHYRRSISHVFLTVFYILIFGLQILCLLFTHSRGPWLGLMGGLDLFIFFSLLSLRRKDENQSRLNGREIIKALVFTVISIAVGVIPAYLLLIFLKRGLRWLWISWIFHTLLIGGILVLLVLPHSLFSSFQKIPHLGRLIQLSYTETGSVKVRMLIWHGTLELMKTNPLRTLTGYGPESIQTVYPRQYPSELAHYVSPYSSVDRLHNETFDVLMTTGLIGLGIYLYLICSIFHFGLKWLGFIKTMKERHFLHFLMGICGIVGVFLPRLTEGTYRLSGVGLPFGILSGAILYLIFSEMFFCKKGERTITLRRPWLYIGLFSALVAHLIEIQFGISVAVTRSYFWIYLAVFVLMGLNWIKEVSEVEKAGFPNSLGYYPSRQFSGIFSGSFLMATGLFTLGFEFINTTKLDQNWLKAIQISLTTLGPRGSFKPSYGMLYMFLLIWVLGGFVVLCENKHRNLLNQGIAGWAFESLVYIYLTLMVFFTSIAINIFITRLNPDFSNTILFYYAGVGVLTLLITWSLFPNPPLPKRLFRKGTLWVYPILILLALAIIFFRNINLIKADIYFKQGYTLIEKKQIDRGIQFYRRAVGLAPDQDSYYAELGRTIMSRAPLMSDPKERSLLLEEGFKALDKARRINPLHSDHYLILGSFFHVWGEADSTPEGKIEKLNRSHLYYKQAADYAPNNVLIYNLWARVFLAQKDFRGALEKLKISLSLDPRFGLTHFHLGEIYSVQSKFEEAEKAYWQAITYDPNLARAHSSLGYLALKKGRFTEAKDFLLEGLRLDPNQPTARSVLGLIYLRSGQTEQALAENLEVLRLLPEDLSSHRNLILIYKKMGRSEEALMHAQKALELSPEKDKPEMQRIVNQLSEQKPPGNSK